MVMETPVFSPSLPPTPSSASSSYGTEQKLHTPNPNPNPRTPSFSETRIWRPKAQRNVRNQWSKLASLKQQWSSASSSGRTHATSLVNAHLRQRYMAEMNLGVLEDLPDIRKLACRKWAKKQLHSKRDLLSAYKDMVAVISQMVNVCSSMRCQSEENDAGDGGGVPVFKFLGIPYFETLANELVQMFRLELILKRLVLIELLSLSCKKSPQQPDVLNWSDELYTGECDDLIAINLYSEETNQPVPPRVNGWKSNGPITERVSIQPDHKALEVHITTWFVEVNIDPRRLDEIFSIVGEEMQVRLV